MAMTLSEIITVMNFSSFINSYLKFKTVCLFLGNAMKKSEIKVIKKSDRFRVEKCTMTTRCRFTY